ncbi:MAG: hypothetical protein HQL51_13105 [Magnetococcales bacterium]|nr:hypothetical protein [Magnetococcales bacterium]
MKPGSERSFGLVFTAFFALVGGWPLLHGGVPRLWAGVAAGVFLVLALAWPRGLAPLNRLWFHFGLLLHRVMTPLVMGILFFAVFTPMGVVMRLLGKDPLRLRLDPKASSYWIPRDPPGPAPESMKHQF